MVQRSVAGRRTWARIHSATCMLRASAYSDLSFCKMNIRVLASGREITCSSCQVLNKCDLPSLLCFIKSSGAWIWLFLFTDCRHKFKTPSWGKGTRLAHWSAARMHLELDLSVCYFGEFKKYSSFKQVLRVVCLLRKAASIWKKGGSSGQAHLIQMQAKKGGPGRCCKREKVCNKTNQKIQSQSQHRGFDPGSIRSHVHFFHLQHTHRILES